MKINGICEYLLRKTTKLVKMKVLGFKEMSYLFQMTFSTSYKRECCRSLSFGWV